MSTTMVWIEVPLEDAIHYVQWKIEAQIGKLTTLQLRIESLELRLRESLDEQRKSTLLYLRGVAWESQNDEEDLLHRLEEGLLNLENMWQPRISGWIETLPHR